MRKKKKAEFRWGSKCGTLHNRSRLPATVAWSTASHDSGDRNTRRRAAADL